MGLDIKQLIEDKSGDRDYFAMVPGLLWPDIKLCSGSSTVEPLPVHIQEIGIELDIYDKWLYASLKKICGEKGGQCFLSTRGLAKFVGMSVGQVSKSKAKLEEAGLVEIVSKKRSAKGQAIDHITVVDVWEENIKLMKARKEGVHLVNALKEKQERSPEGEERSRSEHQPPERSWGESKCSPHETEEEPIEEEPMSEEEKEEETLVFPEKKERTDEQAKTGRPDGRDSRGDDMGVGDSRPADAGEASGDFPDGRGDGLGDTADPVVERIIVQTQTHPGPCDLGLISERAQAKAGNSAVPPSAGGSDAVADRAIACLCGGEGPKRDSGTYCDMVNVLAQAHKDWGVNDLGLESALWVVEKAMKRFLEEKPALAVYKYRSFPADYGGYLGWAKEQLGRRDRAKPPPEGYGAEEDYAPVYGTDPEPLAADDGDCPVGAAIKGEIALQTDRHTFETWIKPARFVQADGVLHVTAPDETVRAWLENRAAQIIQRTAIGVLGREAEIEFEEVSK